MKKKKIALAILLIFLFNGCFASLALATTADSKVFNTGLDPVWSVLSIEVDEEVQVGQEFTVKMAVQNVGSGVAFFPEIVFTEEDKQQLSHFTVVGDSTDTYNTRIERVESGEVKNFTITMKVNSDTKELPEGSSYQINAMIRSNNWDVSKEKRYSASKSFQVIPKYTLSKPTFVVKSVTFDPEVVQGVERTKATLTIENISDTKARNVTISLDGIDVGDTGKKNIAVLDLSNTKRLYDINGKQTVTTTYELELNDDRKNNQMKTVIKYDGQEAAQEEILNMPLPLKNSSSATGKEPKVIIKQYNLNPSKVLAGNYVTLNLYIENTNEMAVNNVSIRLDVPTSEGNSTTGAVSGGTVFSPVNSSNTFYIEKVEGKSTAVKTIDLYVDANAQAKTYVVPVKINYEDIDGEKYSSEDNINIPVTQESKVEIISAQIPTMGNLGGVIDFNIEFVNIGKVSLSNFKVQVESDQIADTANTIYYVGSMEASASDSYSTVIYPEQEGMLEGNVVFTYIDADNQEARLEYPFQVEVGPMIEVPDGGIAPPEEIPQSNFFSKLKENIITILLLIVVIAQAIILFRIKRKAKADEELFHG